MRYDISGSIMQALSIDLAAGETVFSQTHTMAWMSDGIEMNTSTGGGFFKGLARAISGNSFFVTEYSAAKGGEVAFAPRVPGKIIPVTLKTGDTLICRKETFLCAEKSITVSTVFQKRLGAGVFAGEGFLLQRLTGPGVAFLDLSGEVVEKTLAAGERLRVHAGHIGMQDSSVSVDIQMVRGFRDILFGGEGFFLATLTGPGKVWLQTMPVLNLAEEIARHLPKLAGGNE